MRILAVDWSGRRANAGASIWLAEAVDGEVVRLEGGRDRAAVIELFCDEAARDPRLVIGLDFAFSFPEWFVRRLGARSAREVWEVAAREGERWLADPQPPFWRARKPSGVDPFRRTECEVGGAPKSVFQLVGAGQVGTGSLRGMPALLRLEDAGFAIWPFAAGLPLAIEIYPALLRRALDADPPAPNEHARDAAASALVMARHARELAALAPEPEYALEGRIWCPADALGSSP